MKAMTRQELATRAGVGVRTLNNWLAPHRDQLYGMGMRPNRLLPPNVVAWIAREFCIDING